MTRFFGKLPRGVSVRKADQTGGSLPSPEGSAGAQPGHQGSPALPTVCVAGQLSEGRAGWFLGGPCPWQSPQQAKSGGLPGRHAAQLSE